jgi:hypothetical protein
MSTLQDLLSQAVATQPEKLAVVIPDECQLTYTQFNTEVEKAKQALVSAGKSLLS